MAKKGSIGNKSSVDFLGPIDASFKPGQPLGITFEFNKTLGTLCIAEFVHGSVAQNFGLKIGMHLTHIDNDSIVDIPQNLVIEILKRKSNFSRKLTFKFLQTNFIMPITSDIDQYQARSSQKVNINVHNNLPPLRPSSKTSDSPLMNNHSRHQNLTSSTYRQSELPKIIRPDASDHFENTLNNSNTDNKSHHSQSSPNIKLSRLSSSQNQSIIRKNKGNKRNNNENELLDPYSTPARRRRIIADVTMFLLRQYCLKACDNVVLLRKQTAAAVKIQCMVRIVFAKAIRFALHHLKCQNCALRVQTQWRIFLAKSKVSHKRMVVHMKRAKVLALMVQGAWRIYQSRKLLSKLRQDRYEQQQQLIRQLATILLQRIERGRQSRSQARKLRQERQEYQQRRHLSCILIQSQYRRKLTQKQTQQLRRRNLASLILYKWINNWWRKHCTARHIASVKICRWMKRYLQTRIKILQCSHSAMVSILSKESTYNKNKIEPLIYEVHVPIPQLSLTTMMSESSQMILDWCIQHGFISTTTTTTSSVSLKNDLDDIDNSTNNNITATTNNIYDSGEEEEEYVYMIGDILLLATSMAIQSNSTTENSYTTPTTPIPSLLPPSLLGNTSSSLQTTKELVNKNENENKYSYKEITNTSNNDMISGAMLPITATSQPPPLPLPLPPLILKHDTEIEIIINANNLITYLNDINIKTQNKNFSLKMTDNKSSLSTMTESAILPTAAFVTGEIFVKLFLFSDEVLKAPSTTPPMNIVTTADTKETMDQTDPTQSTQSPSTSTFPSENVTVVLPTAANSIQISQNDFIVAIQNQILSQTQIQSNVNDLSHSNNNNNNNNRNSNSSSSNNTIQRNQRYSPPQSLYNRQKGNMIQQSMQQDNTTISHNSNIETSNFLTACTAVATASQQSRVRNILRSVDVIPTTTATTQSSRRNSFFPSSDDVLVGVAPKKYPRVSADAFMLLPHTIAALTTVEVETVDETSAHDDTVSLLSYEGGDVFPPRKMEDDVIMDDTVPVLSQLSSPTTKAVNDDTADLASQYSDRIKRIFKFWNGKVWRKKIMIAIIRIQYWFRKLHIVQKFQHLVLLLLQKMHYALSKLQSHVRGYQCRRKIPFIRRKHCHQLLDNFYEIYTNRLIANNRLDLDKNYRALDNSYTLINDPMINSSEDDKIKYAVIATDSATILGYEGRALFQCSNKLKDNSNNNCQYTNNANWDQNIIHILTRGDKMHSDNKREGNHILNSSYNLHAVINRSSNNHLGATIVNNLQTEGYSIDDNFGDVDIFVHNAKDDSNNKNCERHTLQTSSSDVQSSIMRTNNFTSMLLLRYPPSYNNLLSNKN